MGTERAHVSNESPNQRLAESRIVEVEDILNDIIPKRILDKIETVEDYFGHQLDTLRRGGMVNGSLEDTTAVSVSGDLNEVGCDGVVDELVVFGYELVEAFLDDL